MVSHLEEVDVTHVALRDHRAGLVPFGISRKQSAQASGTVVIRQRELHRVGVHVSRHLAWRPYHPEREALDAHNVAIAHLGDVLSGELTASPPQIDPHPRGDAGGDIHPVARHMAHQVLDPRIVVRMKMRDEDRVEMHDVVARQRRGDGVVWTRVHKQRMRALLHQNRIALPHVEHAYARRRKKAPATRDAKRQARHDDGDQGDLSPGDVGPQDQKRNRQCHDRP